MSKLMTSELAMRYNWQGKVARRKLLLPLDCSSLPVVRQLVCYN